MKINIHPTRSGPGHLAFEQPVPVFREHRGDPNGFVTSAAEKGATADRIMDHTGHRSVAMVRLHTCRADAFADHAGEGLSFRSYGRQGTVPAQGRPDGPGPVPARKWGRKIAKSRPFTRVSQLKSQPAFVGSLPAMKLGRKTL